MLTNKDIWRWGTLAANNATIVMQECLVTGYVDRPGQYTSKIRAKDCGDRMSPLWMMTKEVRAAIWQELEQRRLLAGEWRRRPNHA